MTIDEARAAIGRHVHYTPYSDIDHVEHGEITSVNSRYAFVRYTGDLHSKATAPELLTDDGDT